jgi:alkanesulfonate monooxygenase SsuD/methylene tetrahydromethanopterin reductase-like flavin-dependent oxidoreductase (luciferase family)
VLGVGGQYSVPISSLTFEAEISPGMTTNQVVYSARLAEAAGFDRLGISDVVFWPDCYMLLGAVARGCGVVRRIGTQSTNAVLG